MFVSLFSFEFVALPPSIYFILCIVWSCCVYYYIDILVLTPHFVSRRLLSCLLSLYRDLYLITWLLTCLFDYDFGLVQLNHYFHYIVHLGPHSPLQYVTVWVFGSSSINQGKGCIRNLWESPTPVFHLKENPSVQFRKPNHSYELIDLIVCYFLWKPIRFSLVVKSALVFTFNSMGRKPFCIFADILPGASLPGSSHPL